MKSNMRCRLLISGLAMLTVIGLFLALDLRIPKKGTVESFAKFYEADIGNAYVVGRCAGFVSAWSVSFYHQDKEGYWFGYYLADDDWRWRNVAIDLEEGLIVVRKGRTIVAKYDAQRGLFTHAKSGVVFIKEEGKIESEVNVGL